MAETRTSVTGEPRGPLCGMGICFECRTASGERTCQQGAPFAAGILPAEVSVLVVGAGPAGLAAARCAAESGASVALVDDNPAPGGQIWRSETRAAPPATTVLCAARVIDFPRPGAATIEHAEQSFEIAYRSLVLATGARERFLPFPGWTLPNVTGAGGLQALAKSGLVEVAGKRVVVAGSGPLLLAVADYLAGRGAEIRLIAEQAGTSALLRFGFSLATRPAKLAQALRLRPARYLTACWPVTAHGKDKLEAVSLTRGTRTWREPCDFLACGFGLIPNIELPALAGCQLGLQGVLVDDHQRTSVPGIYCAGEVTGIGGVDLSLVEGEIAGCAAAGHPEKAARLFGRRERHRRFARALERAFPLREELRGLCQPDTLVCRCEDVPYGLVRECAGWREAKLHTRCGMGPCQGRICGGALAFLLGWRAGSPRPPVYPARIASLSRPRCPQP